MAIGLATEPLPRLWRRGPAAHGRGLASSFAQGLIPVAACGVFLGLSSLTVTMLKAEGIVLPFVAFLRAVLLIGAGLWAV